MSDLFRKMYDLAWNVDRDGDVTIEQDQGFGEVDRIILHPLHVRHLATLTGILQGDQSAWERVETLERRLDTLRDRIATLNQRLWSSPIYPDGSNANDPDCIYSDCTLELAEEFCADFPYLRSDADADETQTESGRNANASKPSASPRVTQSFSAQAGLPLEGGQQ